MAEQDSLAGFDATVLNAELENALSRGNISLAFEGSTPVPELSDIVETKEQKAQREHEEKVLLSVPYGYGIPLEERAINFRTWFDSQKSIMGSNHTGQELGEKWKRTTLDSLATRATSKVESLSPDVSEDEEVRWKDIRDVVCAAAKLNT